MLVLTRKVNESICIAAHGITITVIDIRGGKVRLGIDAPADAAIHRKEVQDAIDRQTRKGADDAGI